MRRLPDVVIIGVKKSGTMTLGRTEDIYYYYSFHLCPVLSSRHLPQVSPKHGGEGRKQFLQY